MSRRLLGCAIVFLLAGCIANPFAGSAPDTTDGPTGCDPVDLPRANALNESRSYPELPSTLNRSTARQFVVDFERAFAWHRVQESWLDEVYVYTNQISSSTAEDGFVVEIESVEISTYEESPEGNSVGSDAWSAFYLVNASTVLRAEGHAGSAAETPPRSEWRTVCSRSDR